MVEEKDNSGNKVRFAVHDDNVDKDLSIHPSAHNENNLEGAPSARTADKYYKDMQSIHGDMVRRSCPAPVHNGQVTPGRGARKIDTGWQQFHYEGKLFGLMCSSHWASTMSTPRC